MKLWYVFFSAWWLDMDPWNPEGYASALIVTRSNNLFDDDGPKCAEPPWAPWAPCLELGGSNDCRKLRISEDII